MRLIYTLAALLCIAASVPAADCPGGKCPVKRAGGTVVQVATVGAAKPAKTTASSTPTTRSGWRPGKLLGRLRGCR